LLGLASPPQLEELAHNLSRLAGCKCLGLALAGPLGRKKTRSWSPHMGDGAVTVQTMQKLRWTAMQVADPQATGARLLWRPPRRNGHLASD